MRPAVCNKNARTSSSPFIIHSVVSVFVSVMLGCYKTGVAVTAIKCHSSNRSDLLMIFFMKSVHPSSCLMAGAFSFCRSTNVAATIYFIIFNFDVVLHGNKSFVLTRSVCVLGSILLQSRRTAALYSPTAGHNCAYSYKANASFPPAQNCSRKLEFIIFLI